MAYKLENILFCYEYFTAGNKYSPLQRVIVYNGGKVKWRTEETYWEDLDNQDRVFRLSGKGQKQLLELLADSDKLQRLGNAEEPEGDWGQTSRYRFYFNNGSVQVRFKRLDLEYCAGSPKRRGKYPVTNELFDFIKQISRILTREGADKECLKIPERRMSEPYEPDPNPVIRSFVVYDFQKAEQVRSNERYTLEHYIFRKYKDGSYMFEYQEGWFAGSHNDGGTACNDLPRKWFKSTWEKFLDKFIAEYPPRSYFITRGELEYNIALRKFLGFE